MIFRRNIRSVTLFLSIILLSGSFLFPPTAQAQARNEKTDLLLVARKAFDDGFYDVAIRYLQEFLDTFPEAKERIQAQLLLGRCYFFKTQYLKAFEIFQGLLKYSDSKDATLFWLGETYLKGNDYIQAQKHYLKLIKDYPDSTFLPAAYYSLGWAYYDQGKIEKARDAFLTFVTKYPAHELAEDSAFKVAECEYNLKHYDQAVERFRQYVTTFPQSNRHYQAYFYTGESYYYLGNYPQAIAYYNKAVETSTNPKITMLSEISLGWSYLKTNSFENAKKAFEEAAATSKENNIPSDDILLGQATLSASLNNQQRALELYAQLIKDFPESSRIAEAMLGKANVLYMLEKYKKAIQSFNEILEKYKNAKDAQEIIEKAHFGLAWTYLKEGKPQQAIEQFRIIADSSKNKSSKISALTQIGDTYLEEGDPAKALEAYGSILKDFSENLYTDHIQFQQGIAFLQLDKIKSATLVFQSLQANFPTSTYAGDSHYYLGLAYFKKNDWAAAKDELTWFIDKTDPAHELRPEAYYLLGVSVFNLRQLKDAIKIFERLIKNFPARKDLVKDAEMNIARCLYALDNDKEALKKFKIIAYKYPKTKTALEALMWLGQYYLDRGDYENVILYYSEVVKQFPQSEKINLAYYGLGQAYQNQGEIDKALNQYKLIDMKADRETYAKAQLAIADIFSQNIAPEKAIETYKTIIKSCPEFTRDAYVNMASIYQREGKFTDAIAAYHKALSADKGLSKISDAEVQFMIGDAFESLNQPNDAIDTYLKIPYLYQDALWSTKAYLRMARIFEKREDWENARLSYQKIIDLGVEEAKFAKERLEWIANNIEKK